MFKKLCFYKDKKCLLMPHKLLQKWIYPKLNDVWVKHKFSSNFDSNSSALEFMIQTQLVASNLDVSLTLCFIPRSRHVFIQSNWIRKIIGTESPNFYLSWQYLSHWTPGILLISERAPILLTKKVNTNT